VKSKISALMDGELEWHEAVDPLRALGQDEAALETWRTYHLIGDLLRDTAPLSADFGSRFAARLSAEPTVVGPTLRPQPTAARGRRVVLSAAASVAAAALVGWLAFGPGAGQSPQIPPIAKAPAEAAMQVNAEPARVPLPAATVDYLLAHQTYSMRNALQGVAPYVRTVSGELPPARR